jgi:hypothetical protein
MPTIPCPIYKQPTKARRSTRRYCSRACQQLAYHVRQRGVDPLVCEQFKRRLAAREADPRPQITSLNGCVIERITEAEARPIVL